MQGNVIFNSNIYLGLKVSVHLACAAHLAGGQQSTTNTLNKLNLT